MSSVCSALTTLCHFRDDVYQCLDRRADVLFELTDSLLTAGPLPSPVYLSCELVHRRGWGSSYAALRGGRCRCPTRSWPVIRLTGRVRLELLLDAVSVLQHGE
jgi:hypothetical protein